MYIDLRSTPETVLHNFQGGEKDTVFKLFTDEKTRIVYGKLEPGASIGTHTHVTNCEVLYVLQGSGKSICDGVEELLHAGMCHYCPKGQAHNMANIGDVDLLFFAVIPEQ